MARRKQPKGEIDALDLLERYQDDEGDAEFTEAEIRWMQDHGISQPGDFDEQPVVFNMPDGSEVSNDPAFFAQQQLSNQEGFDALVEQRAEALAKEMIKAEQQGNQRVGGEYSGTAVGEARSGGRVSHPPDNSEVPDEEDDEDLPYDQRTADDLRAEIAARNEDRDEDSQLPLTGRKAELIETLEADDQE